MPTSTSTSQSPSVVPRIKLNANSAMAAAAAASNPPRMTGKHPPGTVNYGRPAAGSKTRPQAHNQLSANGVGGGVNLNSNKLAERKRAANKPAELARRAKPNGVSAEDADGDAIMARHAKERADALANLPPRPPVISTSYILKKFSGKPPSIVVHLHQLNFRFEGQDGSFSYGSPMRMFLECIRNEEIPHDVLEEFRAAGTTFYDGCLIVQVHDHRSSSSATSASKVKAKQDPGSIHNYNEWICPSPMVPFPTPKPPEVEKKEEEKDGKDKGPRIFTTVLHPTPLTLHADMAILASTPMPQGRAQSIAQTPTSATMPRTPSSLTINTTAAMARPKMILDDTNVHEFEAKHLLATSPALILTPAKNAEEAKKLHKALRHPLHCCPFPPPKARKRTMAELQADEAQAAEQERLLLFMDERRYAAHTASGPESAVGDGSGSSFEHSFKKFKVIESLRREAVEKKRELAEKAERDKKARSEHENRARMELRKQQELQKQQMMARNASQQGSPVVPMTRPGSSGTPMSPAIRQQQQHHQQQQPQAQAMAMQHSLSQHSQHASSPRPPQAIPHTQSQQQQQQQHLHSLSQAPIQQQIPARVNYPNQLHRQNLGLAQAHQAQAQAQAHAQAQAAHRASPHPQQMQSPHPQQAQPVVTQAQVQAAAYHQMAAQHNQMLQQFSPEQIRAAAAQHQHQQMMMQQQRQIQLGRGGQFVGKNVVGALRGRGGMPPQMQQQQQQQQGFQDFGINIGAGMQQQQQQQINMMGRGMPMGRGR